MKLEHEAGKEVYIDFAGKKLHITDKETGELIPVEVFIAILPNSQYTYVEACMSQKRKDLVSCMVSALSFFGGVPRAIVSDNLKSAVTRASKYEPNINRTFKDFARHYGCVINHLNRPDGCPAFRIIPGVVKNITNKKKTNKPELK